MPRQQLAEASGSWHEQGIRPQLPGAPGWGLGNQQSQTFPFSKKAKGSVTLGRLPTASELGPLLGAHEGPGDPSPRADAQAQKSLVNCGKGTQPLSLLVLTHTGSCFFPQAQLLTTWAGGGEARTGPPGAAGPAPAPAHPVAPQSLQQDAHPEAAWNCPPQVPGLWLVAPEELLELGEGWGPGLRPRTHCCPMGSALSLRVCPTRHAEMAGGIVCDEEGYAAMECPVLNPSTQQSEDFESGRLSLILATTSCGLGDLGQIP